ncbi:putative NBD/HSP70 family sugar kinase [Motilibacter rhizosphaerae]|uniref:Putative NBD/HSP70 family sugar kinase n=1 Tax=Motilibacter rhizosphaerae TaxID=598652 RepID=A0A4Q7NA74_9ACTN|nr:ROK family protein [Motilibacter rhizosphaerae]RZS79374.1 putative NBD/HSP70 family sugar kinase [Motilibacter rhizosphaerae]
MSDTESAGGRTARDVVALIRARGPLTRAEVLALTRLPKSTVNGAVQALLDAGVLVGTAAGPRGPGRPGPRAVRLDLAPSTALVGVVALSHSRLRAGLVEPGGRVRQARTLSVSPLEPGFDLVDDGERLLREMLEAAGADQVDAVAIGIPAPFQQGRGVAGVDEFAALMAQLHPDAPPLPAWMLSDPAAAFTERFQVPAVADNDANLAALGESRYGAGHGHQSMVFVKIVDGVGAGIVINGQLIRGAAGLAGEIAHIQAVPGGPLCACGRRGCLAAVLSTSDLGTSGDEKGAPPTRLGDLLTMAAFRGNDVSPAAVEALRMVGRLLADVCLWLSPDAVVLDGLLAQTSDLVVETITDSLRTQAGPLFAEAVQVVPGALGGEAELLGGLALTAELEGRR